jgi:Zn-dependent protease
MGAIVDLLDKIKRYYRFTPSELKGFVIATLAVAFIISFEEWGTGSEIDVKLGLLNLLVSVIIVGFSFWLHISVQRIWSLITGYKVEWKMWSFGLLLGLIFVFLTNGNVWLILPGGIMLHQLAGHRLGWFRYDINWWAMSVIALTGPVASIALAVLFKAISGVVTGSFISKIIIFNVAYALYSLIPIPPLDGSRIIYGSRLLYAFFISAIVAVAILLSLDLAIFVVILSSFVIAIVFWLLYYIFFESHWWGGA